MKPIDVFITCYLRQFHTEQTITYLKERTIYPYRLFMIDQGGNDEVLEHADEVVFLRVKFNHNIGIHGAWNCALAFAESEYFITSDNDILVPKLDPDWLTQLVKLMDERPDYGAISLHPHIFIGRGMLDPKDPEDVKEESHCGAVMRIMRTEAVRKTQGWEHVIRSSRNHEEHTICGRLREVGYKVGICTRLRAFHSFGNEETDPWGYPKTMKPADHGHREIWPPVNVYGDMTKYDNNTWMPLK